MRDYSAFVSAAYAAAGLIWLVMIATAYTKLRTVRRAITRRQDEEPR